MYSALLIRLGRLFSDARGLRLSTVGRLIANHGAFFSRLEDGRTITEARTERVCQQFSDHWPEELEWPTDIPRPAPSGREPGKTASVTEIEGAARLQRAPDRSKRGRSGWPSGEIGGRDSEGGEGAPGKEAERPPRFR